jgi:hypothetical protein
MKQPVELRKITDLRRKSESEKVSELLQSGIKSII